MTDVPESERLTRVEGQVSQLAANVSQLSADVRLILDRIGTVGKPNWAVVVAAAAVMVTVVATSVSTLYLVSSLQINTTVSELKSSYIAPLESKAEVSIRDRGEIRAEISRIAEQLNRVDSRDQAAITGVQRDLTERETQNRAADQYHNVQWASTLRFVSLLWKRSYGEEFPDAVQYYPSIAQPPNK